MNFEEKIIERLKRIEREVERLRVKERPAGGSGVTDHGALTGLSDDDHPQYLLTTGTAADSDKLDGLDSTAFAAAGHDHDTNYLGITAKASDSDKLDNIDSTGFVQTSGNQTVGGIKTFTSIPALPSSNPTTANQAVRKGFADATYLGITAKAADSAKLGGIDAADYEKGWIPTSGWKIYQTNWVNNVTGAQTLYSVGDKIKFTNGGSTKYFYVVSAPTSESLKLVGDTTVGAEGTDLTDIYCSHAASPTGFPPSFLLPTPTWTTTGTPFTNQPINQTWKFTMVGSTVILFGAGRGHSTSGGTGRFFITFPENALPPMVLAGMGLVTNYSSTQSGFAFIDYVNNQGVVRIAKYDVDTPFLDGAYWGVQVTYL